MPERHPDSDRSTQDYAVPPGSVERVRDDMCRRWRAGDSVRVEAYLPHHPEMRSQPDALLDLIYQEVVLREERGEAVSQEEYLSRFPDLGPRLRKQFEVHRALEYSGLGGQSARETKDAPGSETQVPAGPVGSDLAETLAAPAQPAAELPDTIGKYRVIEHLGSGGQGDVYRAVHPHLGRDVVLKWARDQLPEDQQRRLLDEGRVLAQVDDPGVVRVHDVEVIAGRPLLVFEYVRGRPLADVLKAGPLPPRPAAALAARVADVLERVHRRGILHRDIKPANLLLDEGGQPRLLDFGLASLARPWGDVNQLPEGSVAGTLQFMAPEQAAGRTEQVGPRTDVFGLGAVLYCLLTGQPPIQGPDMATLWQQAREAQVLPPRQHNPRIPRALERICLKALAFAPEDRFASAGALAGALRGYLRRRAVGLGVAALGLMVLGLGGLLAFTHRPRDPEPSVTPPVAAAPLAGELVVRVSSAEDGGVKQHLRLEDFGAVPVRNGERLSVEARLNQPAHIYLLWVDAEGLVQALYPWNHDSDTLQHDLATPPPALPPCQEVRSPSLTRKSWEMQGKGGLETILLLARRQPLPAEVSLATLVGKLPPTPLRDPGAAVLRRVEADRSEEIPLPGRTRGAGARAVDLGDPLGDLRDRLRPHFELIRGWQFSHQED
jgi:serine/threonine-protein kinase